MTSSSMFRVTARNKNASTLCWNKIWFIFKGIYKHKHDVQFSNMYRLEILL